MTDRPSPTEALDLEPRREVYPHIGAKLDHVCAMLGVTQAGLAQRMNVQSSAISQWRSNGIPRARVLQLCRCVGITIAELELPDLERFRQALRDADNAHPGMRWRSHVEQFARTGLELELLEKATSGQPDGLLALYREPVAVPRGSTPVEPLSFNDKIGFRLPLASTRLPAGESLRRLVLFIDDSVNLQLVTTRVADIADCTYGGQHVRLPRPHEAPYFVGPPEGKQSAFLVLLSHEPDIHTWARIANAPDGTAADLLLDWMKKERVASKISRSDFIVVRKLRARA